MMLNDVGNKWSKGAWREYVARRMEISSVK